MVLTTWADVLSASARDLWIGVVSFIPNLVVAIIIFVIGWLIGVGIGRLVKQIVDSLRIDTALRHAGVDRVVDRAGFTLSSGWLLGTLVKWFIIIVFLVAALDVLHLEAVNAFLSAVVLGYLPQVIVAVLILLAAAVIADAVQRLVSGSARAAELNSANFLGNLARWAIWIFAILAALAQLQVAAAFMQILFTGVVIAISLAFGLAFGLGGQTAASRYIEHVRGEIKD